MKSTITNTSYQESNLNSREFLEVVNLRKSYRKQDGSEFVVLDNVNLAVGENEYISVVGHSGCGKSTLLKIVAGLEKATTLNRWLFCIF